MDYDGIPYGEQSTSRIEYQVTPCCKSTYTSNWISDIEPENDEDLGYVPDEDEEDLDYE
jgi:hypothetical protein